MPAERLDNVARNAAVSIGALEPIVDTWRATAIPNSRAPLSYAASVKACHEATSKGCGAQLSEAVAPKPDIHPYGSPILSCLCRRCGD